MSILKAHFAGALLDITSNPEVLQIFNVRIVQKLDIFLPGCPTCSTFKKRKKKKKKMKELNFWGFFFQFFFNFFLLSSIHLVKEHNFWHQLCVRGPNVMAGKMFENISPDSVRSSNTCTANLGVRSCPVMKLICPVRSSPIFCVMNLHFHFFPSPKMRVRRGTSVYT